MSQCIAVIGGAGFVGTRLCGLLHDTGRPFVIVDKRLSESFPSESVVADVRDLERLHEVLPANSVWVNLAAEHRDDISPKSLYDEVNVEGAKNLCRAAVGKGVDRIVFTSSVACYGNAPPGTGEDGAIAPFNDYGRTKFLAEEVFRAWQQEDTVRRTLAIVRPTVIFGEQNRGNVYNLLRQIASGRFVMVGAGSNTKSMAYVGNVAAFLVELLSPRYGNVLVNYVDEPAMDMNQLVSMVRAELGRDPKIPFRLPVLVGLVAGHVADQVAALTGRKLPISTIRVRKFISDSHFISKAKTLGFEPPHTMVEALRKTIHHEFLTRGTDGPVFFSE